MSIKINNMLLQPRGEIEQIINANTMLGAMSKGIAQALFYGGAPLQIKKPDGDIFYYDNSASLPLVVADEVITMTKYTVDTTYAATLTITGEIPKMDSTVKTALYGSGSQTHATVCLIALPTDDYTKIKYKADSTTTAAITATDVVIIDGIPYLQHVVGAYDSSGTTTCATTYFTIEYGGVKQKTNIVVSGATLAE